MLAGGLCIAAGDTAYSSINTCSDTTWDSYGATNPYCATNYWAGAKKKCSEQGMRLPNQTELNTIYTNKATISGLISVWYWADTDYSNDGALGFDLRGNPSNTGSVKHVSEGVRCVK